MSAPGLLASHLPVLPIVLPFMAGALALLLGERHARAAATLVTASCALLVLLAGWMLVGADAAPAQVYLLGDWPVPFGIVLVVDRLSALMVALGAALGLVALMHAPAIGRGGRHFHALWAFQLAGINGAFLTGDLFNLFVFFEVLLIASYGLLLHGAGGLRTRAALHYVVVNLAGSALFLLAVGLLYAVTGTLNMADFARRVPQVPAADLPLLHAATLLLFVVFGIKAAALPLNFWLPSTYGAAPATVAALFGIMTKVGVYCVLRVASLAFGDDAGASAGLVGPGLLVFGLATVVAAMAGVLAARTLGHLAGYLVAGSAGTLLAAAGIQRADVTAGALLYLVNSTLATAALYLLIDHLRRARGSVGERLQGGAIPARRIALGAAFFTVAMAMAGVPPLAGFVAKLQMLAGALDDPRRFWLMGLLLVSGLVSLLALARAGSRIFWKAATAPATGAFPATGAAPGTAAATALRGGTPAADGGATALAPAPPAADTGAPRAAPLAVLLVALALLTALAGPLSRYLSATAAGLHQPSQYVDRVLQARPVRGTGSR